MKVKRNYKVVRLSDQGTLVVKHGNGMERDTGEKPHEWVTSRAELRTGGQWDDHYTPAEKTILREGLKR
jgi:hypothetical protein